MNTSSACTHQTYFPSCSCLPPPVHSHAHLLARPSLQSLQLPFASFPSAIESELCGPVGRDRVATHLKFFLSFPSLLLFLLTFEFHSLHFLLRWSQNCIPSEEIGDKTCLKLFLALPGLPFFLLTFMLRLSLLLLRWSWNGTLSEGIGTTTYLEVFLPFSSFLLFLLVFKFLLPPFLLQWGWSDTPPEEAGLHTPRVFFCAPSC